MDERSAEPAELTIGDVAQRTGLSVATLRMWETRHGVPVPRRLPGGHRRYSARDVELVLGALRGREAGLSLAAALRQAQAAVEAPPASIYAALRRERPDLRPTTFAKRALVAMSHAIEDEACSRAERPLLAAGFQRETFYRAAERRWRAFAGRSRLAVVFADFASVGEPADGPLEVPVAAHDALTREWVIVCDAPDYAVCMAAWEVPAAAALADADRRFETVWTTEPAAVRAASQVAWRLAGEALGGVPDAAVRALERPPSEVGDPVRRVAELADRMLAYVHA